MQLTENKAQILEECLDAVDTHTWTLFIPSTTRQRTSTHPVRSCVAAIGSWPGTGVFVRDARHRSIRAGRDGRLTDSGKARRAAVLLRGVHRRRLQHHLTVGDAHAAPPA